MAPDTRHILIVMQRWVGYLHGVQVGLSNYFLQRPAWIWTQILPRPEFLSTIGKMKADGVIAYVEPSYLRALRRLGVPVVDVSNWVPETGFPRVLADDVAIGRMAADYFFDLGLRHFAVVGPAATAFGRLRCKGFAEVLAKQGLAFDRVGHRKRSRSMGFNVPPGVDRDIFVWLLQAPKPVGVFGLTDDAAVQVLTACRAAGVRVPDDACVLGVDNDELITRVGNPPLSSIALPTQRIGFEAARLLEKLMAGEPPPPKPLLFLPISVVARQSTDLLAIADKDVQTAVRYIRERVYERVTVKSLLKVVPLNRRYLERKFRQYTGRTPLQEIRRVRLEKAKELLSYTDMPMPAIAKQSGFPNPERMANIFRAVLGLKPTEYRRRSRLHVET